MAYITAAQTAAKRKALKDAFPGWKFSVRMQHHSTLVVTVLSAPINLLDPQFIRGDVSEWFTADIARGKATVHAHNPGNAWQGEALDALKQICAILNDGNHDNSDISTDYFDVGWYVRLSIGDWQKPFQTTAAIKAAA